MKKNIKHIGIYSADVETVLRELANAAKQTGVSMGDFKRTILLNQHYILREQMRKELRKIIGNETS